MRRATIICLAMLPLFVSQANARSINSSCFDVRGSKTIVLDGVLLYQIFPGPPNYNDIRKGDSPEPSYILKLERPICAYGNEFGNSKKMVDRIDVIEKEQMNCLSHLIGQEIVVGYLN